MKVFKYQATGNDFILTKDMPKNPEIFAKSVCDRHFGIGADGILFPSVSEVSDIKMNYYNADGTIAKMCGNGIRAFARFLFDEKMIDKHQFNIETLAGIKSVEILDDFIKVDVGPAKTNIGEPDLNQMLDAEIPYSFNGIDGYVLAVGTLHTVIYLNDKNKMDILNIGPMIQNDPLFTDQTNVNFIEVLDQSRIHVQTFERGSGWTLSCGTGVSASVYHALLKDYVKGPKIHVSVPGGTLDVEVVKNHIYLIGPAKRIMDGNYNEKN